MVAWLSVSSRAAQFMLATHPESGSAEPQAHFAWPRGTLLIIGLLAFAGYALVGAGLAMVVPILYNAATRVPGTTRAAAIASVSSIGYAGFLVGPPLVGSIAQGVSLSAGLVLWCWRPACWPGARVTCQSSRRAESLNAFIIRASEERCSPGPGKILPGTE